MGKIAVCFPGQGSQKNLMGYDLYQTNDMYKKMIDQAFEILPELKTIMFNQENALINQTRYSQVAIYSNQVALYTLLKEKLPNVGFAGFSLGEYSAFACAGLYTYEEGLEIINQRSILMDGLKNSGVMYAVIGVIKEELEQIIDNINKKLNVQLEIANCNTEKQQVLAGLEIDFIKAMSELEDTKIKKIVKLKVSGAFHTSRFLQPAKEFFKKVENMEFKELKTDVYSNITADVINTETNMKKYFEEHMVTGVAFYQEVMRMIADGYDTFIELGEIKVLGSMIKSINRDVKIIHINSLSGIESLEEL